LKDVITINKLKVYANIGILPHEREVPQEIYITIQYTVDAASAAERDDITATVSYADVREKAISITGSRHFDLIETLAEHLAQGLLDCFSVSWVSVEVCKPAIFADAEGVSICIERS